MWNTLKEGLDHNENKNSLNVSELKKGWTSIAFGSNSPVLIKIKNYNKYLQGLK